MSQKSGPFDRSGLHTYHSRISVLIPKWALTRPLSLILSCKMRGRTIRYDKLTYCPSMQVDIPIVTKGIANVEPGTLVSYQYL